MSNTIRRKNAWDKELRIAKSLKNINDLLGIQENWFRSGKFNKYKGWTKEKVIEKTESLFHSDNWFDDQIIELSYKKGWNQHLRNKNKMELIQAIQNSEEENFFLTRCREVVGFWVYYD